MKGIDWKFDDALQTSTNLNSRILEGIRAKASYDIGQLEKEASNYSSQQDRFARENVASIQGDYGVQMRKIIKAGQESLAQIQGEYNLANTKLSGEYGLESDRIRGNTARDVASRQQNASIFGALLVRYFLTEPD